jgi:hypothetical protein
MEYDGGDFFSMNRLSSQQALELTAAFAQMAERMRAGDAEFQARADMCEIASRVAFLKARLLAKDEELRPMLGQIFRRAAFTVA